MSENKKILLCVPKVATGCSNFINRQDVTGKENLGIMYIGGVLRNAGADIKITVFSNEEDLLKTVKHFEPDFVGFTSLTYQSPLVAKTIEQIKKQFSQVIVFVGGDHASAKPEDFLNVGANHVIVGEGEKAVIKIFNAETGEKTIEEPLLSIGELNDTFPLRMRGWGIKNNLRPTWPILFEGEGDSVVYCVITRRGCGRSCDFCNSGEMWKRKIKLRTIESIEKELIDLNSLSDNCGIAFVDLDFFVPISYTEKVISLIIKLKEQGKIRKSLKFFCLGSFPPFLEKSEKIFSKMFEAGFVEISFGVEVLEEKQRLLLNKGIGSKSNWMDIVGSAADSGIATRAFLMLEHPNQDESYYHKFLQVVGSKEFVGIIDTIRLSLCTPLPGTRLWQYCKEKELFLPNFDPGNIEHYSKLTTDEQVIKAEVNLEEIRNGAIKNFYFPEYYLNCDRTKKFSWIKKAREAMMATMNT